MYVGSQHQPGMSHSMMAGKGPVGRAGSTSASSMASYGSLPVATTGAGTHSQLHFIHCYYDRLDSLTPVNRPLEHESHATDICWL